MRILHDPKSVSKWMGWEVENTPPPDNASPFAKRLYESGTPMSENVEYKPNSNHTAWYWWPDNTAPWADQREDGKRPAPTVPEDFHDPNTPEGKRWFEERAKRGEVGRAVRAARGE